MDSRFQTNRCRSTGVWPLGAQVARTDGSSDTPDSSSNTISAFWRRALFYLRPALLDPARDGFVIAFCRSACRSLPAPVQLLAQDVPHPCWVVRDPRQPLDHLSHAFQGPQIVRIAVGFGTLGQRALDLPKLFSIQLRQPPRSPGAAQPVSAGLTPHRAPIRDDLMAHAHLPSDLGWSDALREQVRSTHPSLLHRLKVTSGTSSPDTRPCLMPLTGGPYGNTHPSVSHSSHGRA